MKMELPPGRPFFFQLATCFILAPARCGLAEDVTAAREDGKKRLM